MSRRHEELERQVKSIRDFIIDVYEDPPIGPLLFAYEKAISELVRKQHRGRLVQQMLARFATRLSAVRWKDERKLMRILDGPFATLFVLYVQQINSGKLSPREAATRWAHEISAAYRTTAPSPDPLHIDLEKLEAAFTRAAFRHDRFTTLYYLRKRRWRPQ